MRMAGDVFVSYLVMRGMGVLGNKGTGLCGIRVVGVYGYTLEDG